MSSGPLRFITSGTVCRGIGARGSTRKEISMLMLIVVLVALWALGLLSSYTLGGLIHILLVVAVIALVLRLISGRRVA
jgi:hypothetical protein